MTLTQTENPSSFASLGNLRHMEQPSKHAGAWDQGSTSTPRQSGAARLSDGSAIERPLSAPPPPGFVEPEELSWGGAEQLLPERPPDRTDTTNSSGPSTDSFSTLEAMFGKGLALSMEDAATSDLAINANHQRQTRHAASRLVGTPLSGNHAIGGQATAHLFDSRLYARAGTQSSLGPAFSGVPGLGKPDAGGFAPFPQPTNGSIHISGETSDNDSLNTKTASGMWTGAREFTPASQQHHPQQRQAEAYTGDALSAASSISDTNVPEISAAQAENELRPFLWDLNRNQPCRTLAILRASWLRMPEIRSSCESFGVLESFRADFFSKGICFVSYYDIRSAEYAALELQSILQRMSVSQGCNEEVMVRYCLPLNASSQFDESQIMIHDLPGEHSDRTLAEFLTSYGATRSVIPQGGGSYIVEFHNMQDAKQAQLELDSSQPFGPNVTVEVGLRNPAERKRGRELLTMISRWRQGLRPSSQSAASNGGGAGYVPSRNGHVTPPASDDWNSARSAGSRRSHNTGRSGHSGYGGNSSYNGGGNRSGGDPQVIVGPDGRLMQVVSMQQQPPPNSGNYRHQQVVHHQNGQVFLSSNTSLGGTVYVQQNGQTYPATVVSNQPYMDHHRRSGGSVNSHSHYSSHYNDNNSIGGTSGRSHRSGQSNMDDRDNRHLLLDLDAVEADEDGRTSLMVRNIPNKYTQQMLLTEFMENGLGPGVIDFFYLPIDFKNRCNRGYAFINFVDFKDILPFHKRYFGKHWRTFNSDKICDITYARIQGKSAMLKRFENSALMEKDDEYKPLVFVSDGPDKGKRLPFPDPDTNHHR